MKDMTENLKYSRLASESGQDQSHENWVQIVKLKKKLLGLVKFALGECHQRIPYPTKLHSLSRGPEQDTGSITLL